MRFLQHVLDDGTDPWGVQVERVEMYVVLCFNICMESLHFEI